MVECNLAKVEVEGSNPFSRSIFSFSPTLLKLKGRRRQVAKAEVCKTSIGGSNPPGASNFLLKKGASDKGFSRALGVEKSPH